MVSDWTSFRDIGQSFGGVILTEQEYKRVESAYIDVALAFLAEAGLTTMRVAGLENSKSRTPGFHEGDVLDCQRLREIIGGSLRGEFWCRIEGEDSFIHFGWDYYMYIYMYIGVSHRCPVAEQKAARLGLYVEGFASPIIKNKPLFWTNISNIESECAGTGVLERIRARG